MNLVSLLFCHSTHDDGIIQLTATEPTTKTIILECKISSHSGKEKLLGDAYIDHVLAFDSPQLSYITFDFHEYCRGLKFENVAVLLESIQDILKNMRYCWVDHKVRNATDPQAVSCGSVKKLTNSSDFHFSGTDL